ncbi:MAG: sll0787 family AIR synthase-like protein [Nitrospinota bacterium]
MSVSLKEISEMIISSRGFAGKLSIRGISDLMAKERASLAIMNGDDAAAIPDGDGYLLLAAEGIIPELIEADPFLAGRSAVIANVNDIYAMGGRPLAIVDVVLCKDAELAREIGRGIIDNAKRFKVPVVGGHTILSVENASLSVAIIGRAKKLITSFDAEPGDAMLMVYNPDGIWLKEFGIWNSTGKRDQSLIVGDRDLLPQAAEAGLVCAGKDISFSGIAGTTVMLCETSGCGAVIDIEAIPAPPSGADISSWLVSYFSYGFLLAVSEEKREALSGLFEKRGLKAATVGWFKEGSSIDIKRGRDERPLWDWRDKPFTGFGKV